MAFFNRNKSATAPEPTTAVSVVKPTAVAKQSAVRRTLTRGYEFITRRPEFRTYFAKDAGSETLFRDLENLRWQSRQQYRSNPIARKAVDLIVDSVIGTGLKPHPQCSNEKLRDDIKALYESWSQDCDAAGRSDFGGLQARVLTERLVGGECFYLHRAVMPNEQPVPYRIKLLAAEYVPVMAPSLIARGGIENDPDSGRPIAYWMYDRHPDDVSAYAPELIRVEARHVGHVFKPSEESYSRGDPYLTPVLINLATMNRYNLAELDRKEASALFLGFITKKSGEDNKFMGEGDQVDSSGTSTAMLDSRSIQVLEEGEDIKFHSGVDVGGQYGEFITWQMRQIATGLGVTYEDLTTDMEKVNDRTIRASQIPFRRMVENMQRHIMVYQFCQPVYKRFILAAIAAGKLTVPAGTTYDDLFSVRWTSNGWKGINPVQEEQAYKAMVRDGFMSRSQVVDLLGGDIENVDAEQVSDHKRADSLGLAYDTDARRTGRGGDTSLEAWLPGTDPNPEQTLANAVAHAKAHSSSDGGEGDEEDQPKPKGKQGAKK